MRLGIFLCTCNNTINIDFKNVKKGLGKEKEVEVVELHDKLCQDGLDYIIDDIRRLELDGVIIVGCTEKKGIFERVTSGFGCDTFFLNVREHCGWVHERKEATEKAKSMLKAAIRYVAIKSSIPEPKKIAVDVGYDVLVIGDGGAIEVAKSLSNLAHVHLLTKNVQERCDDIVIHVGEVKGLRGNIGEFEVEIERNINVERCISCGLCADACPKNAIRYDAVYTIEEGCDECGDCIEVCPTGAIEFHNCEVIHAGQILVVTKDKGKEWKWGTQFGIYTEAADDEDALGKAIELVSNLGEIEKNKFLELDSGRCASGRSGLIGCEFCLPCPYEAIRRDGEEIAFSDVRCQGCGICTSLCPLSVPQLQEYPNYLMYSQIENLLSSDLAKKILLVVGPEHVETLNAVGRKKIKYPALLPLFVPRIGLLSETHILSAFAFGADGVIILGGENCHRETIKFANMTLSAFDFASGERVLLISDGQLLDNYAKISADFVEKLSPSPLKNVKTVGEIDFDEPKREVLLDLIQSFASRTKVHPTLIEVNTQFPFADVLIDASKCTMCNACVNMCPTNALSKAENKINFVYGRCIACGLCERACPEEAIDLKRELDFSRLVEKEGRKVVESELIACAGCGKLFMSRAAFERISELLKVREGKGELSIEEQLELLIYCEDCRATKAVEKVITFK